MMRDGQKEDAYRFSNFKYNLTAFLVLLIGFICYTTLFDYNSTISFAYITILAVVFIFWRQVRIKKITPESYVDSLLIKYKPINKNAFMKLIEETKKNPDGLFRNIIAWADIEIKEYIGHQEKKEYGFTKK